MCAHRDIIFQDLSQSLESLKSVQANQDLRALADARGCILSKNFDILDKTANISAIPAAIGFNAQAKL